MRPARLSRARKLKTPRIPFCDGSRHASEKIFGRNTQRKGDWVAVGMTHPPMRRGVYYYPARRGVRHHCAKATPLSGGRRL